MLIKEKIVDVLVEGAKSGPPLFVIAASGHLSLQDWVYIGTLVYLGLQAGWLVWRWWRAARTKGWTPAE